MLGLFFALRSARSERIKEGDAVTQRIPPVEQWNNGRTEQGNFIKFRSLASTFEKSQATVASLPCGDHAGLFVATFPTPPSTCPSTTKFNCGPTVSFSIAQSATATVLDRFHQLKVRRTKDPITHFEPR